MSATFSSCLRPPLLCGLSSGNSMTNRHFMDICIDPYLILGLPIRAQKFGLLQHGLRSLLLLVRRITEFA